MTAELTGDPLPEEELPEHALLGSYRLVQRLGEGGMGVVHLALDRSGRAVALKVLRPHVAHEPAARARLAREVDTLSRVRSPLIAPVLDADLDGDRPYIVTRYVPGPTLDEVVENEGPRRGAELHRLGAGLAEALEVIHSAGVIHRDLKPGNVLLVDGEPVVIDFGIAHIADDVRLTMTGLVMGTPGYLAPEIVDGDPVSQATDWWGWAATVTYAAAGRPPFGRGPMDAVLARVSRGEADLAGVDPRLAPLLYAALAPDPARRPHAREVVAALERYAHGGDVTDVIEVRPAPPTEAMAVPRTAVLPTRTPEQAGAGGGGHAVGRGPLVAGEHSASVTPLHGRTPAAAPPAVAPGAAAAFAPAARGVAPVPPAPAAQAALIGAGAAYGAQAERSPLPYGNEPTGQPPAPTGESDWESAQRGHGLLQDPRIGRAARTGTLAAMLLSFAAGTAALPLAAGSVLLAWAVLARTADRSVTALVMRRHEKGRRSSDVPIAIVSSPWHLVVGVVGAIFSLIIPALVAISAAFSTALAIVALQGGTTQPNAPVPLAIGGLLGALIAWWGPGGASLRRGTRSIVRGVTPGSAASSGAVLFFLVLAAGLVAWIVLVRQGEPSWWPMGNAPSLLGTSVSTR